MRRLTADITWALTRLHLAGNRYLALPFKELPSATAERFPRVDTSRATMVAMRDGTRLRTDVYLPADRTRAPIGTPVPAMLIRMPYGVREAYAYMPAVGRYWARRGYAAVLQDVRGRFGSEGVWTPFAHEGEDGWDTIDWVARQPWCDGRVAMSGESYYAFTQWAAAASGHPALACVAPGDMGLDQYTLLYEGGALCLSSTALWACDQAGRGYLNPYRFDTRHLPVRDIADAAGLPAEHYRAIVDHPARDDFWAEGDRRDLLDRVEVPVLVWSGWYDNLLPGTLQCWTELERRRPDLRDRRRLVLAPTDHETSCDFDGRVGRIPIPAGPRSWDRVLEFTDAVLAGEPLGPRVRAHVTGEDTVRYADTWPPPDAVPLRLFLRADGELTPEPPTPDEPPTAFAYDPCDPVAAWEGRDPWAMTTTLTDRRPLHARADVLVYRSTPLPDPVTVLGDVRASVSVATGAPDADVTVTLLDIWPDGYAQLVQEGIRRLSHRDPAAAPRPVEPGRVYRAEVELGAGGHRFAAGHRIGVELSGSAFDRWDRNPHAGRHTVHHDGKAPSHLDLPILGGRG
ncbi:CocE/NonD family hydrolase [Embleya sp. AB8]|uniref:CocE/NonD family hydrolase n=1 Tax=Embleya sp. AB8 TaxID=3156304 RepID=UPI003C791B7D